MTNEERIHALVDAGTMEIDDEGRVWYTAPRRRAERQLPNGYLQIRARFGGGQRVHALAHRVVFFHFHGPIGAGHEINHRNGIKSDNRPSNIESVTTSANQLHARRELGIRIRETHQSAKLTVEQVKSIRKRAALGASPTELAKEHGIARTTVCNIVARRTWQTVK